MARRDEKRCGCLVPSCYSAAGSWCRQPLSTSASRGSTVAARQPGTQQGRVRVLMHVVRFATPVVAAGLHDYVRVHAAFSQPGIETALPPSDLGFEANVPGDARARTVDTGQVYTHGEWHVEEDRHDEFIAAWQSLGRVFAALPQPPAGTGVLIQSTADPTLFYSFGPWQRAEYVEAMRNDDGARAGIRRLVELCSEARPGTFRVLAESDQP